ncbi:DUF3488 and transglutaminase-like domain-containing protein [Alkalimonas sp. MEB108]|uniref:DUF3488 and transglutaminase-like domain-containing protein n=1 Tax=Alkalimonas cellulosilytica TaxID=3058395 RepID=A0ABU7J2B4_9GAMM|nr:DUF3488 and transglutaminase-like domain-containing protein [Alkalimonas sp. MEB108]MEE2000567.1 DUF3488 and transglutaminase-like domain-containing protein [Alkalimonas sp. MEB108]
MLNQQRFFQFAPALQLLLIVLMLPAWQSWSLALLLMLNAMAWLQAYQKIPVLSLRLVNVIAAIAVVILLLAIRQLGAMHFLMHILLLSALLRLLALSRQSEARQLIWVQYFILGCSFLFHQSMAMAVLIFSATALNLLLQYLLFAEQLPSRKQLAADSRFLLLLIPLWLGSFLLFPRLAPLWQLPSAQQATTGLANEIEPGTIEQLVQSNATAFRVRFDSELPAQAERYWRAKVFEQFDGRRWSVQQGFHRTSRVPRPAVEPAELLHYQVIAEPSFQRAVFSLGTPVRWGQELEPLAAGLLRTNRPISQRISYQLSSALQPVPLTDDNERRWNLVTGNHNARSQQFADELLAAHPEPHRFADAVLEHFRQHDFYYTLNPPLLGRHSVDDFLFESRAGFCSHYASAMALLLRQAGIPARVVGGYLGGDWYPEQQYLLVRQRDAHAWVEYLVDDVWHPVDPTAAIAPERVLDGLDSALSPDDMALLGRSLFGELPLFAQLRLQLLHLDYYWSVWVLGFNQQRQDALWQSLRQFFRNWQQWLLALVVVFALLLVILAGYQWRRKRPFSLSQHLLKAIPQLSTRPPQSSLGHGLNLLAETNTDEQLLLTQIAHWYERSVFASDKTAEQQLLQLLKQQKHRLKKLSPIKKGSE